MASFTIRNIDDSLKSRLRVQAAIHGRSMEDEARDILRSALNQESQPPKNLGSAIHALFAPLGLRFGCLPGSCFACCPV